MHPRIGAVDSTLAANSHRRFNFRIGKVAMNDIVSIAQEYAKLIFAHDRIVDLNTVVTVERQQQIHFSFEVTVCRMDGVRLVPRGNDRVAFDGRFDQRHGVFTVERDGTKGLVERAASCRDRIIAIVSLYEYIFEKGTVDNIDRVVPCAAIDQRDRFELNISQRKLVVPRTKVCTQTAFESNT